MKILAIIGSPHAGGNTRKAVECVERALRDTDASVSFEYIELSQTRLEGCRGCYACLLHGEHTCPLKDDRAELECMMKESDGVIFASPVYTYNVSWIMKNFLDRFAYRCHRPDFIGKKAMIVVSTGAVGIGFVKNLLAFMTSNMGFTIVSSIGMTFDPVFQTDPKTAEKERQALKRATKRFYDAVAGKVIVKPSLLRRQVFKFQKRAFAGAPKDSADYLFWHEKGWLDEGTKYYE